MKRKDSFRTTVGELRAYFRGEPADSNLMHKMGFVKRGEKGGRARKKRKC